MVDTVCWLEVIFVAGVLIYFLTKPEQKSVKQSIDRWASSNQAKALTPRQARTLILSLNFYDGMIIDGDLLLANYPKLKHLPKGLQATRIRIHNCRDLQQLPDRLSAEYLSISDCPNLVSIPANLDVKHLSFFRCTALNTISSFTGNELTLGGFTNPITLPDNLNLSVLRLHDCPGLTKLPNNLQARAITMRECPNITMLPIDLKCENLQLNVANERLIENTPLEQFEQYEITWFGSHTGQGNSVIVPAHVLKHPERLTPQQILNEPNAEVRRVMLERHGPENFIRNLGADPVQEDQYGVLYRVELSDDEPLVMVRVKDASTNREYFLRVPPDMQTAHEAVAWTFGMTAEEYHPDVET